MKNRLITIGLLVAGIQGDVTAQAPGAEAPERVLILASRELPPDLQARIVFRMGPVPKAAIVIRADSSSEEILANAYERVLILRERLKERSFEPNSIIRFNVPRQNSMRPLSAEERRAYGLYLFELKRGPEIDVPGAGRGKGYEVFLRGRS